MRSYRAALAALSLAAGLAAVPAIAQDFRSGTAASAGFSGGQWAGDRGRRDGRDGPFRQWTRPRGDHDRGDRRRERRGKVIYYFPWDYYGGDYESLHTFYVADSDFFYQRSPRAYEVNGSVHYEYDRGYPYEYYNDRYAEAEASDRPSVTRCRIEETHDGPGREVNVRVCRR